MKYKTPYVPLKSVTSLVEFGNCPRLHYLSRTNNATSGRFAKGIKAHSIVEHFWAYKNNVWQPKYKSAESMKNAVRASWIQNIKHKRIHGLEIRWSYESEPWVALHDLEKLCLLNYDRLVAEGPPLISEHEFNAIRTANRYFSGRIDEIRQPTQQGKIVRIRDYKTGHVKQPSQDSEKQKNPDFQLTLYVLALLVESRLSPEFRRAINIPEEKAKEWNENNTLFTPEIELEYYALESENNPIVSVRPIKRLDYLELCRTYDLLNRYAIFLQLQHEFPAHKSMYKCDYCFLSKECEDMSEQLEEHGEFSQLLLNLGDAPEPAAARSLSGVIGVSFRKKRKPKDKDYKQLTLPFPRKKRAKKKDNNS